MSTLQKLTPNQDLQCYFYEPSAVAALSATSPNGFTVSGCWREQCDWAVVEWNRDNVFEHPVFRNLPDGDLSGLQLSYQDTRTNCIAIDSNLYATVDWPYLRVWADPGTGEQLYRIPLAGNATPVTGSYAPASATFTLQGVATGNDYIEIAWDQEHYTYQLYGSDTLETAAAALAKSISTFSQTMQASASGPAIILTAANSSLGANGNRIGVYGNTYGTEPGGPTESWLPGWQLLSGGESPTQWQINLNFSAISGLNESGAVVAVPMNAVRKMRWTWAADLQSSDFARSEFSIMVSDWVVTATDRTYQVAGPGSWRVEDGDSSLVLTGNWAQTIGNYSGGTISCATTPGASISYSYLSPQDHNLNLGTRRLPNAAQLSVQVDQNPVQTLTVALSGEDILVRWPLGTLTGQTQHTVTVTQAGENGSPFYLDFLEIAIPTEELPSFLPDPQTTLATDWDTLHSQALAPERTAWLIQALGFTGRANHYAGALWFYELVCSGQRYATGTITFSGSSDFGKTTTISLGPTVLTHLNLIGDTPASLAVAFQLLINEGSTGVWAAANGEVLTITARTMGTTGNGLALAADSGGGTSLQVVTSGALAGGVDGDWLTDLTATPRMNRAARDWSQSFFAALKGYNIQATASFSTELGNGDPSAVAAIAQRYPDGTACMVNTPALQTNFSTTSLAFWQEVYLDMANVMNAAGIAPYLQFGEIQWWYFCPPADPSAGNWTPIPNGGMPFYDAYTTTTFQSQYGRPMYVFTDPSNDPTPYPQEASFLPGLIGQFTAAIMAFVRQTYANAQFEVLYPPDTNDAPLTSVINLPGAWNPTNLNCFKTENFTYTGDCNLNAATTSIEMPAQLGFAAQNSAHLVGIGNYMTPWAKESRIAKGFKLGSVVLFALDQCCLIGYGLPLSGWSGLSLFMGS
ncbi:MAG: hypothetical protein ABSH50_20230 [Bryobacteraceae bacterium]|jgi:hypothetical protein